MSHFPIIDNNLFHLQMMIGISGRFSLDGLLTSGLIVIFGDYKHPRHCGGDGKDRHLPYCGTENVFK